MAAQNSERNTGNLRPWRPGQSGNPGGRPKTKAFKNALEAELEEADDDGPSLRKIARVLLDKAATGDIQAIRELADRLAGKPTQMLEHTGEEGRRIGKIVHEIVHVNLSSEELSALNEAEEPRANGSERYGKNLLVDYHETEAINGHGSNGSNGSEPVLERVGRHRP